MTIYGGTLPPRLNKVDELILPDHCYLNAEDDCYFIGEYTARGGFGASPTNQLILNLKKGLDKRGRAEWKYKGQAIRKAANMLRVAICAHDSDWLDSATLIPIPPSKVRDDPDHDDRILQVLHHIGTDLDIRELIVQRESTVPCHKNENRPTPSQIAANYEVDESLLEPTPDHIIVMDDILTTGSHFKAIQRVLRPYLDADIPICAVFIARRVPESFF